MKPILKNKRKLSFRLKAVLLFTLLLIIISFYWGLKYSGAAKRTYADLEYTSLLEAPVCKVESGFYNQSLSITLESNSPDSKVYYTLDGSEPKLSSNVYTGQIAIQNRSGELNNLSAIPTSPRWKPPIGEVFKGTVLRAISVDASNRKSTETVRTFFVDREGRGRYSIAVVSLVINFKDFFGYNNGIYVLGKTYTDKDNYIKKNLPLELPWWQYPSNYLERGMDSERPAYVEMIETSGKIGFSANTGVRIHGNATRGYAQKSLRVCFRKEYGQSELYYDLFGHNKNYRASSFILRNSGNDWDKTMFRDALMQSMMRNSSIDIQDYRPSVVFINGEYWGIHNIRERFDEDYLAGKYNINKDSVTILELNGRRVRGEKSDEHAFSKLLSFVKNNDLSDADNYKYVSDNIDIKSFQDFIIANVFFCNSDWPNNNVRFWKYNANTSDSVLKGLTKWRWMLYDTDWGFGYNSMSNPEISLLEKATKVSSSGVLFKALIRNPVFVNQFLLRFQDLLNSTFSTGEMLKRIDSMQSVIAPEMEEHIARWRSIGSYSNWLSNVDVLRDFARRRPQFQVDQLNAFFDLQGAAQISLKK